ncbi:MAG: septal ring lytic transglycosylase RlpA family protein [Pseudomonadales bacterium]
MSNLNTSFTHHGSRTKLLRGLLIIFASLSLFALNGCTSGSSSSSSGGRYALDQDGMPDDGRILDPDNIPDAVPKLEPRTAAGNKSPYTVLGETYQVMPESNGYSAVGKVSWYGKKFHGYKTSNGEIYDLYKMTAAHRTLPIPSYVRVTNLANNRTAIVRVNDRGPFHSERIMDLSYAAAVKLDIVRSGTARVRLEAIDPSNYRQASHEAAQDHLPNTGKKLPTVAPKISSNSHDIPQKTPAAHTDTYLQAGAFRQQDSALALRDQLIQLTGKPVSVDNIGGYFKVRIGPLDPSETHNISELLMQRNLPKPQVVYF